MLGRSPSCDIQFTEPTVSRSHAQILRDGKHYYLEDLDSQHGTLLNGERVRRRQRLKHADEIEMGECRVLFEEGMTPDGEATAFGGHESADETSGTQVLDAVKALEVHRDAADQKLGAVLQIMHNVGISLDIERILPAILESTLDVFPTADRGCIQLLDEDGRLQLAGARSRDGSIPKFDISQTLVTTHSVFSRELLGGLAGANHVDAIQSGFLLNGLLLAFPCQEAVIDCQTEVFANFVLVQHSPDLQTDFVLLQRLLGAAGNFPGNALELDFSCSQ